MDGAKLKHWRLTRNMTIRDLADKSGVNHSAISELERNKRTPHPSTIGKLADALGVANQDLMRTIAIAPETLGAVIQVGEELSSQPDCVRFRSMERRLNQIAEELEDGPWPQSRYALQAIEAAMEHARKAWAEMRRAADTCEQRVGAPTEAR